MGGHEEGENFMLSMKSPRESAGSHSARALKEKPLISSTSAGLGGGEEEAKDLPAEEFKDFFSTYDQDIAQDDEGTYLSLDDALNQPLDINESKSHLF